MSKSKRSALGVLYLSGFIDYAGVAIVYPIFAYLFFEPNLHFFSPGATDAVRGMWLGILVALYPALQFISAPIFGALSDQRGRKKLLALTLFISAIGYVFAILGVMYHSLALLASYRILVGIGAGNGSILAAMVADLSEPEEKSRHFGFLSMSFGAGFTIAPFIGGILVKQVGYMWPFVVPMTLVSLNVIFVMRNIQETRVISKREPLPLFRSFSLIQKATQLKGLRSLYLSLFVYTLGWAFFTEFIPLFLHNQYGFDPSQTGIYYGYAGLFYALSAGFLAPPVINRLTADRALPISQIFSGFAVAGLLFIYKPLLLWFYMPVINFFMAFYYPTTSTVISNRASKDVQGEAMGIYQAVMSLGMAVCPFMAGSLVSVRPQMVVLLGGGLMTLGGVLLGLSQLRRLPVLTAAGPQEDDKS